MLLVVVIMVSMVMVFVIMVSMVMVSVISFVGIQNAAMEDWH
jgi:hypothetical protein